MCSVSSYYEKILATGEVKCIDDEVPFEIPQGWEWERLGNITTIKGGKRIPVGMKLTIENTGHKYIRVADMKNHSVKSDDIHYISDDIYEIIKAYYISKDDLYITVAGTIGNVGVVPEEFDNANLTENADKIEIYSLCKRYLLYALLSEVVQEQVRECTTKVGQPKLAIVRIQKFLIPIAPLAEQRRISDRIDVLLPIVDKYDFLFSKLGILNNSINEVLKKSILQEAIQGKLVPQIAGEGTAQQLLEQLKTEKQKLVKEGKLKKSALNDSVIFRGDDNKYYEQIGQSIKCIDEEVPFEIPNSWAWSRLSSICSIVNGFTPLRSESKFWDCGTINWFTVDDIKKQGELIYSTKQKITEEATSKERIVRAGSVLLCCTASVGQCALAKIDLTTNQQFNALTVKDINSSILSDNYLFWFAKTLKPTLQRLSGKTTFEFISVKKVGNILIPIPPFKEQERIVAKIEKLFEQLH